MIIKIPPIMYFVCNKVSWAFPLLFTASVLLSPTPAPAEGWRIGVYSGQWADTRLPHLPYNTATGRLTFSKSYVHSVILSKHLMTSDVFIPGTAIGLSDAQIELESTTSVHSGHQTHQELTLGIMLRSRKINSHGFGWFSLGWANGLSYALREPSFEYGRRRIRGQDTVQLQYYMGFEAEYTHASWRHFSVFARLHHRSGIYGVISPSKTGSNLLGLGVRLHLGQNGAAVSF